MLESPILNVSYLLGQILHWCTYHAWSSSLGGSSGECFVSFSGSNVRFIGSALTQVLFLLIWPAALHTNFKSRPAVL